MADDLDAVYQAAAHEWNVDPRLLKAVSAQESGGKDNAVSSKGAVGRMQLLPSTAKGLGVEDPTDPVQSIYGAAKYLNEALTNEKTPEDALRYYHGGPNWRAAYGPESHAYAPAVTAQYQKLAGAQPQAPDHFTAALSAPAQTAAPAGQDHFAAAAGGAPDHFAAALAAPEPAQQQAAAEPTMMQKIGAGLTQAAHDMTDVPAEYLAKGADAIGLTPMLAKAGIVAPAAPQVAAADQASRAAYDQNFGNSNIATAARIGGQIAGTLPMLATGGGMLSGAADVAGAAAGRIAPWAGRAVEGATNLLSGGAGSNIIGRTVGLAANGALQGAAAGALTAGQSDAPISQQMGQGAMWGAAAGPVAGLVGAGAKALGGLATGAAGGAPADMAALAKVARDTYGIPIQAPQISKNTLLRAANEQSSRLPFSGAGGGEAAQQSAWQRAVSQQMGENTDRITPEVMSSAAKRIGSVFNDVAARTKIAVDEPLMNALGQIETEANSAPLGHGGTEAIRNQISNILDTATKNNGQLDGQAYQQLTRAGSPLSRAESAADPNVRYYAGQVRDALDGAFQRSAAPEDQAALGKARGQWRAMKTIEDLVEKSPDGNLSPALLMGQVRNASNRFDGSTGGMAYTGGGALGDLARIGQAFLKPSPNSTTADRALVNGLAIGGGGILSGLSAHPLSAAGIPVALGANRLAGAYLRSGGYANRVINSSINGASPSMAQAAIPFGAPAAVISKNRLLGQ